MHVRLRFFKLCTVVVAMLAWTMTAAASVVIAAPTAQIQEPTGSSPDDGRLVRHPPALLPISTPVCSGGSSMRCGAIR